MPGRSPQAAVTAYLRPLEQAISVLAGHTQITIVRQGAYTQGKTYHWELNGGHGVKWPNVGELHASSNFVIVDADPDKHGAGGELTVSTRGYWYKFVETDGYTPKWRIHWHPEGENSSWVDPHYHFPPKTKKHFPSPRTSLEQAIRWCLVGGAPRSPSCTEQQADDLLTKAEAGFRLYCSWTDITSPEYIKLRKALTGREVSDWVYNQSETE